MSWCSETLVAPLAWTMLWIPQALLETQIFSLVLSGGTQGPLGASGRRVLFLKPLQAFIPGGGNRVCRLNGWRSLSHLLLTLAASAKTLPQSVSA